MAQDTIQINQSIGAKPRIPGIPLDADNVLIVVGVVFFGVILFYGVSNAGYGFRVALIPGVLLLAVTCAWVFLLRQGKPASYDVDFMQTRLLEKKGWEPDFQAIAQFEKKLTNT
jgi:hypothetical protein